MKAAGCVVTLVALACVGCAGRGGRGTDSPSASGTIVGSMLNTFVHGAPFYGSVVYLVPDTQVSRSWWHGMSTDPDSWMWSPRDLRLPYVGRTTSEDGGLFAFSKVPPGAYFLHANVFWVMPGDGSSPVHGSAWIGTTTVAPGETVRVTLRPPEFVFRGDSVGAGVSLRARPMARAADSLPAFGEYVFVTELPEVVKTMPPVYPDDFSRAGPDVTVVVAVLVGKDGRVRDVRVTKSIPMLDDAAVAAVKQYEFRPARRGQRPVAMWTFARVRFKSD